MVCAMKRTLLSLITVFAVSAFAVPHISIQSPVAGHQYRIGDTLHFHWTNLDTTVGGGCQIEISFDNGVEFFTVDDGTGHNPGDATWGNFDWVITDSLSTINSRMRPVNVYTISDQVIIHIVDFYNKLQDTQTYPSGVFKIGPSIAIEKSAIRFGLNQSFSISPNPARGIIAIQGGMDHVSLFDLSGKLLRSANPDAQGNVTWNVEALPAGAYIVKAKARKEFYSKKITIQK